MYYIICRYRCMFVRVHTPTQTIHLEASSSRNHPSDGGVVWGGFVPVHLADDGNEAITRPPTHPQKPPLNHPSVTGARYIRVREGWVAGSVRFSRVKRHWIQTGSVDFN